MHIRFLFRLYGVFSRFTAPPEHKLKLTYHTAMNDYRTITNNDSDNTQFQLRVLEKLTIECADVEELLSDYIDHELLPTLQCRVADHIGCCDRCTEAEEDIRMVVELAATLRDTPVPDGVSARLKEGLNEKLGLRMRD